MSSVAPFQLRGRCIQCNCGEFRSGEPDGYWTACKCRHPLHSHVDVYSDLVFQCERTQCAAMFQATARGQHCACSAALWDHKLVRNTRGVMESLPGSRDSGGGPVLSMTAGLSQPEAFPNRFSPAPLDLHADSTVSDAGYAHLNGPVPSYMRHVPASRLVTLSPSEYRAEMRNEMFNGTSPSYMEVLEPTPPALPSSSPSGARLMSNLVNPSSYGYQAHTPASGLDPSFPVPVVQPTSVRPMNDAGSSIMHNRDSHGFVPQTEAGRLSTFPVMQSTSTLPPSAAQNTALLISRKKRDTDSFVFYDPNTKRFLH